MAPIATKDYVQATLSAVRAKRVTVLHPARLHLRCRAAWAPWRQPSSVVRGTRQPAIITAAAVLAMCFALLRAYDRSTPRVLPQRRLHRWLSPPCARW